VSKRAGLTAHIVWMIRRDRWIMMIMHAPAFSFLGRHNMDPATSRSRIPRSIMLDTTVHDVDFQLSPRGQRWLAHTRM